MLLNGSDREKAAPKARPTRIGGQFFYDTGLFSTVG
jgi:hypothetical protein